MSRPGYDLPSLVAGVAVTLFGVLLLLDAGDVADLGFAILAPSFLAVCGAILVATGLSTGRPELGAGPVGPPMRDLRESQPPA